METVVKIIEKRNPATGMLIRRYPASDGESVRLAVEKARQAQILWAQADLKTRARVLADVADRLYRQAEAVADTVAEEIGKPGSEAIESDVAGALGLLRYYAAVGPARLKPRRLAPDFISRFILRTHWETWHPRGVIAVIAPWNYPIAIPVGGMAAALMAGNAVVFKPSEHAPACGLQLAAIFREALMQAGFSPDLLAVLLGDGETGQAVLRQSIDGVIFTGSARVGRDIRVLAAERGLWSSLELGGSDAMLLLEEVDPDWAVDFALWGRFTNAGQACASVKRLFVPSSLMARFLPMLRDKTARLRVGPPSEPGCHLGPLISETQRQVLDAQVQDAIRRGATLLSGGGPVSGKGWFYQPTLLTDVPPEAAILTEEAFGPVLPIIVYDDVDAAIAQINASPYGLTTSILGDAKRARLLAGRLESGTVVINDAGATNFIAACAPWGGWKESGHGVSHGERALADLCRLQLVSRNGMADLPGFKSPPWHFLNSPRKAKKRALAILTLFNGPFRSGRLFSDLNALFSMLFQYRTTL